MRTELFMKEDGWSFLTIGDEGQTMAYFSSMSIDELVTAIQRLEVTDTNEVSISAGQLKLLMEQVVSIIFDRTGSLKS